MDNTIIVKLQTTNQELLNLVKDLKLKLDPNSDPNLIFDIDLDKVELVDLLSFIESFLTGAISAFPNKNIIDPQTAGC